MKSSLKAILLIISMVIISCGQQNKPISDKGDFIVPTEEIIENADSSAAGKQIISYDYEKDGDVFWKKATYKDNSGKVFKSIEREFNDKRFPVKEIVSDNGTVQETDVIEYNTKNYEMSSIEIYVGDIKNNNKIKYIKNNYDNDGSLISQEISIFSKVQNFKNAEGNSIIEYQKEKIFPLPVNRPKGFIKLLTFTETKKVWFDGTNLPEKAQNKNFKTGSLIIEEHTQFGDDGLPVYFKSTMSSLIGLPYEEWYSSDKDGLGNVTQITAYSNSSMDNNTENNLSYVFEYDEQGFVSKIETYRYNKPSDKFDLLLSQKTYKWNDPQITSPKNFFEPSVRNLENNYSKHLTTLNVMQIEKYNNLEKITIESNFSGSLDTPESKIIAKPTKRIIEKFKKIIRK